MIRIILLIFAIYNISSCGLFKSSSNDQVKNYQYKFYEERDYLEHLASLSQSYLGTPGIEQISLNNKGKEYLNEIYTRIVRNNELLMKKDIIPKFYIINTKRPFYFSLPQGHFFLSLGLVKKYIQYEEVLVSLLCFEILKVHLSIYPKSIIVPVGYIKTERMMSLLRLPIDTRFELNKWAFLTMKRAGYDAYAYISWLQIQNRNTLDFILQLGDSHNISREEFMFKNFIVQEGVTSKNEKKYEVGPPNNFYDFINYFKRFKI